MRTVRRLVLAVLLPLAVLLLVPNADAPGCAPAFHKGASVRIANESALIIWDASRKTEHFIRRGTFDTSTPDFGFLVPTPSEPELRDADDGVFDWLEELTKPEEIYHLVSPGGGARRTTVAGAAPAPTVAVLGEQRVAGFDAVKLKATDTRALLTWLKKHGYDSRPALETWLDRYVKDGWVITAFKIARAPGMTGPNVSTKALRMTFKTDQPFYPYREPEDMRSPGAHPGRFLRVFVLATEKVEGSLGKTGSAWPGNTVWADTFPRPPEELMTRLDLMGPPLPGGLKLTVFEDASSPRPGEEELFFRTAGDPSIVKRPPIVHTVHGSAPTMPMPGGGAGMPPPGEVSFAVGLIAGLVTVGMLGLFLLFCRNGQADAGD